MLMHLIGHHGGLEGYYIMYKVRKVCCHRSCRYNENQKRVWVIDNIPVFDSGSYSRMLHYERQPIGVGYNFLLKATPD